MNKKKFTSSSRIFFILLFFFALIYSALGSMPELCIREKELASLVEESHNYSSVITGIILSYFSSATISDSIEQKFSESFRKIASKKDFVLTSLA